MINEKAGHVSFGRAFKDYFRGYVEFLGRTTRAGYWWTRLILFFVWLILFGWLLFAIISAFMPDPDSPHWTRLIAPFAVMLIVALGLFLPELALKVRRYRDVGLRGRGAAVLLGVQYLIGMMINIGQSSQTIHQFEALRDMNTTAVASVPSGIGWVSSLVSLAFGLFFFVLTVLPSDTMLTTSDNAFVRFFIRAKEDDEPSDSDPVTETSAADAEDVSPVDKESDNDHDHD